MNRFGWMGWGRAAGWAWVLIGLCASGGPARAAGAAAAPSERAERVAPPAGVAVPGDVRLALAADVARLGREIEFLEYKLGETPALRVLLPDVRVYHKAVDWALRHDEFLRTNDVRLAPGLLEEGMKRCAALREGRAPWLAATGLVVRGYVSRLDGSVQPYGLVVPATWAADRVRPRRLDVWLHGRDNLLTELKFIADRQRSAGEFAPADALVLHPYGRYCNAFKFAGEIDVFEAMAAVGRDYPVDLDRVAIRGFSMGGAGAWHLAVHHAGRWAAAAPGAGFAETAVYTKAFEKVPWPRAFEQRLWNWYDATAWAMNLAQCRTIAYSGEVDPQRQAAEIMAGAMAREGLELTQVIGPGTAHKYEPGARREVARRVDEAVAAGRATDPDAVRLVTWTLRYPTQHWVTVEGLEEHWRRSVVEARRTVGGGFEVQTTNIARFSLGLRPGPAGELALVVDGERLDARRRAGQARVFLAKRSGRWRVEGGADESGSGAGLRKRPGLQGPIDDAFMDRFLFVRPTGRPLRAAAGVWLAEGLRRATNEWRAQFRGDAPVKDDVDVTAEDVAGSHLILWGDPQSNRLLGRMIRKLPLRWTERRLELGPRGFPADSAVPVLIYPNPMNPSRYVVLNSGFTFWRFGDASNAQQTPKLPDYAVLDLNVPAGRLPARGILSAGFFDEQWRPPPVR